MPGGNASGPGAPVPAIWGVVNVTPDSFSDGGCHAEHDAAVRHAVALAAAGAAVLDVGGESTRPGAEPVSIESETARVVPVLAALAEAGPPARLSVDTRRPEVARAALRAGACIVNDVQGGRAPGMFEAVAEAEADLVLMHMQGTPRTMQARPTYADVVEDVARWLGARVEAAEAAGLPRARLWIDPGIGFGKTLAHNLELLRGLERLRAVVPGVRILLGASRKSFLGALTGREVPRERLAGSLACVARACEAGVDAVRVHDVRETCELLRALAAFRPRPA